MEKKVSSIDRLRSKLYSRKEFVDGVRRRVLSESEHHVAEGWQQQKEEARPVFNPMATKKRNRFSIPTLLVISIGFFVISLAISAFFFLEVQTQFLEKILIFK